MRTTKPTKPLPPERWKCIEGFPGYEVSDHGRVRSFWKLVHMHGRRGVQPVLGDDPMIMSPAVNRGRYLFVTLYRDKKKNIRKVHRMVLEAFVGASPAGFVCCHNNGNCKDNTLCNLRWDTPKSNAEDRKLHGTQYYCRGENSGTARLTDKAVCEIKNFVVQGWSLRFVGKLFGITSSYVSEIARGKSWAHLDRESKV